MGHCASDEPAHAAPSPLCADRTAVAHLQGRHRPFLVHNVAKEHATERFSFPQCIPCLTIREMMLMWCCFSFLVAVCRSSVESR